MSDNKNYYYIRVKENFYESEEMMMLQALDEGYLYSDILMKLYLKSLKNEGRLMFKEHIPYNIKMLSVITKHSVSIVEKALHYFKEFGLIDVLDNGAIYMMDIQLLIGKSSTEGDRKKAYREKIKQEKDTLKIESGQTSDKRTPELELEKELEKELELQLEKEKCPVSSSSLKDLGLNALTEDNIKKLELTENEVELLKDFIKNSTYDDLNKFAYFGAKNVKNGVITRESLKKKGNDVGKFNKQVSGFREKNYDYDALQRELLGWDED